MSADHPSGRGRGPSDRDAKVEHIDEWLREARTASAASARAREHWLAQQSAAGATTAGLLVDLAERDAAVVAHTVGGATWRGTVEAVGSEVAVLRIDERTQVVLALRAIASLRADARRPAGGDRDATTDLTMHGALALAVAERPRVQLVCGAAAPVQGLLVEVGDDVVAVRSDDGSVVHVPIAVVDAARLR